LKKPKKGGVKPEVLHGANMSNLDFAPGASIERLRYVENTYVQKMKELKTTKK